MEDTQQLGELGAALHRHLPEGTLAELADGCGEPAAGAEQERGDVRRLEAAIEDLDRGLPRDLPADRVETAEGRLSPLVVDAQVGPGRVGDHLRAVSSRSRRVSSSASRSIGEGRGAVSTWLSDWRSTARPGGSGPRLGLARLLGDELRDPLRALRLQLGLQVLQHQTLGRLTVRRGALGDGLANLLPNGHHLGSRAPRSPPGACGGRSGARRRWRGGPSRCAPARPAADSRASRAALRTPTSSVVASRTGQRLGPGRCDDRGGLGADLGGAGGGAAAGAAPPGLGRRGEGGRRGPGPGRRRRGRRP